MAISDLVASERSTRRGRGRDPWARWIPQSWYAIDNGNGRDRDRDRGREIDRDRDTDLDDTRSFRRRYDDYPTPTPKVQVPFGVVVTIMIYLIGQLVGGVWWAATLQSNLQHEITDRGREEQRLWESIQTYRLEVQALRVEAARSGSKSESRSE